MSHGCFILFYMYYVFTYLIFNGASMEEKSNSEDLYGLHHMVGRDYIYAVYLAGKFFLSHTTYMT